jgi:hypothetical protein
MKRPGGSRRRISRLSGADLRSLVALVRHLGKFPSSGPGLSGTRNEQDRRNEGGLSSLL